MALWRRDPAPGLIHHSDRRSQYTSISFGARLEEAGIVPSMGSVADPYDNVEWPNRLWRPSNASCWTGGPGLPERR